MSEFEHPETQEGEIWVCNFIEGDFNRFVFETKRAGDVAYNARGELIRSTTKVRPLFVQKAEWDEKEKEERDE